MFGIGAGELLVLLALALIIVGPEKLPQMARTVGRSVSDFKSYTAEMRSTLSLEDTVSIGALTGTSSKPGYIRPGEPIPWMQQPTEGEASLPNSVEENGNAAPNETAALR